MNSRLHSLKSSAEAYPLNGQRHHKVFESFILAYLLISPIYVEQFLGISLSVGQLNIRAAELILFVMAWGVGLVYLTFIRRGQIIFPGHTLPLLLLLAWSLFKVFHSPDARLGLRSFFQFTLFFCAFLSIANIPFSLRLLNRVGIVLLAVIIAQFIAALYQTVHPVNAESLYSDIIRSRGMLGSGNGLSFFALYLFAFFFPFALRGGSGAQRWWLGCLLSVACILLSQTRVALGILVIVVLVGYIAHLSMAPRISRVFQIIPVVLGFVLIAGMLASGSYFQRIQQVTSLEGIETQGTLTHRLKSWGIVYDKVFASNPVLGGGGGASEHYLRNLPQGEALDAVHNEYIKILADYGLIGIFLFIWWLLAMLWSQFWRVIDARKSIITKNSIRYPLMVTSFLVTLIFILGSVMHNMIYAHEVATIGWIISAFSYMGGRNLPVNEHEYSYKNA